MLILEQSESDKLSLLKKAIENKVEVSFYYKGVGFRDPKNKKMTKQGWRFVQPTDIGRSKATNKWMLRAYQDKGTTNTKTKAWKTFLVDEISSITLMDGLEGGYHPFKEPSGSNFNRTGDKKMKNDTPELKIDLNKEPLYMNLKKGEMVKNKTDYEKENKEEPINESNGFLKWILNLNYG